MKKFKWLFLALILLLAFLLGARMILVGDFYYLFDQARDYLLTQSIVKTHSLVLIGTHSGLGGFFHGPLWLYIMIPFYILGMGNPFFFTDLYIGLQILTVFAAFLVGSKLYGNKGGLLISLLVALSPVIWSTVPNTIGVNAEPLVFLGLFYCLIKFLRGERYAFVFAAFFAGLTLQFETALPLVLAPIMVFVFVLNKKFHKDFRLAIFSIAAYILSLMTFILFDLRHQFLMTKAVINTFTSGQHAKGYLVLKDRIAEHLNSLLGVYKSMLFNQNILLITLFAFILVFATYLFFKTKNKYKKEFFFLLAFPAAAYLFFIFYPYPIWPEYILGLLIPVTLAFYLAIIKVWKKFFGKALVAVFFIAVFLNVSAYLQNQYLTKYQPENSSGTYKNQLTVIKWLYQDAGSGRFGYFVYSPSTYTHGPDYLISWYGKNYPKTVFESKKDTTTYLLLYPHLINDNGAYDFWKKNVLKTQGQVISTKEFSSGITVQKLLIKQGEPPVDPNYYQGLIFR